MADIEKVKQTLKYCADKPGWKCDRECLYSQNGERTAGTCWVNLNMDALSVIEELQAENERLCKKIGVMKESIEDAIMSETVFDTFDDLSSYVNAERCRSEEWTGGIRDAIQAVRAWGE